MCDVPIERIARTILVLRGHRCILDSELAALYGVETRVLNQAIKRNSKRFPRDFMFALTTKDLVVLRSQFVISRWGGRRSTPFAFTEHGALMAATVLNSPRAIEMSLYVVRTFMRMREVLATHARLASKLADLERRIDTQDETILEILSAIKQLMSVPDAARTRRPIGFVHPK